MKVRCVTLCWAGTPSHLWRDYVVVKILWDEVRATQLAQASERVGSQYQLHNRVENLGKVFNPVVKLVLENQPFLILWEFIISI